MGLGCMVGLAKDAEVLFHEMVAFGVKRADVVTKEWFKRIEITLEEWWERV